MNEYTRKPGRIGVFLVDDHEIFRRGIRALLAGEPGIDVVGEAETASAALARIPALRPDVAVLDVRLPDGSGISVCREIRSALPQTACLMLTGYNDEQALMARSSPAPRATYRNRPAAPTWSAPCARSPPASRSSTPKHHSRSWPGCASAPAPSTRSRP